MNNAVMKASNMAVRTRFIAISKVSLSGPAKTRGFQLRRWRSMIWSFTSHFQCFSGGIA